MCGIAGIKSNKYSQSKKSQIVYNMCNKIIHRGPDSDGYFVSDDYALGMRRLRVIDLETGEQPVFNHDKSLVIIFNGEIYNYRQLKEYLEKLGYVFQTNGDTEVILNLFEEEGIHCLDKLNGMFAFAILDIPQHRLLVARDMLGIKPLYYYYDNGNFAFASELKAILEFPLIKRELNYEALNYYLTFENVPAPLTIFKNINKLEPGNYLEITKKEITKNQYYYLNFQPKLNKRELSFYIDELDCLLDKAVDKRTASDVPLGCFLSGGIDSSLITAYLTKNSLEKVKTFSIGFKEKSFDESNYARIVANHLHTQHFEKIYTPRDLIGGMEHIVKQLDEPFADASILPTYLLSQFARQEVTVALSGDGSDEIFGGYPTYFAHKVANILPPFLRKILEPLANMLPVSDENISLDFKIKKFISGLKYDKYIRHQIWLGSFDIIQKMKLFSNESKQVLGDKVNNFDIIQKYMQSCNTEKNWEQVLWLDMRFYLQDNMLVKADRASMMNSLEVRVPFLDHEVVDFMTRVPTRLKYKGRVSKYLLKQLAQKYLPKEIIQRPKKGFGIPVAKWIKKELKDEFLATLSKEAINKHQIFDYNFIKNLLDQHFANKQDNRKLLWTLFMFQKWYGEYLA